MGRFEAGQDTLKVVADYVSPLGLRLLITSGSYVPEAKLPSRVIDTMTSVDVDLESHLAKTSRAMPGIHLPWNL
jgi:hypothetical protein